MNRLDTFLDLDVKARDRAALVSVGSGMLWGIIAEMVLGARFSVAAYQSVGLSLCVYAVQIYNYCGVSVFENKPIRPFSIPRRVALAAYAYGLIALLNLAPMSSIEAAVLDRRLRRILD